MVGVVCIHLLHTALGVPVEGIEQMLLVAYQSHPNS
jgi:hypothetical protein